MAHQANVPALGDTILLAEDNADHVLLIKRSFIHARILNPVQVARDGLEAIAYLNGEGEFADRAEHPFPALLLLDLKMPNKDGFEVMEWIRERPHLPKMRIVVLTTSERIFDVKRAYALGANGFLTKPLRLNDFIQLGPAIHGFWVWNASQIPDDISPPPPEKLAPAAAAISVGLSVVSLDHTSQSAGAT